jgi:type II secretory pathway pseudopilin PulG
MNRRLQTKSITRGIVLLALLLFLALISIALMGMVEVWSFQRQREAEAELLYVGGQYRQAIEHYYYATPGAAKSLPKTIDDLLEDQRFPMPMRHLRRADVDPITGKPFDLVLAGEQLTGVSSSSTKATIKRSGFSRSDKGFEGLETYNQWKFLFLPPTAGKSNRKLPSQPLLPSGINGRKP